MKIIRYADSKKATHYAIQHPYGRFERLAGRIYDNPILTGTPHGVGMARNPPV